MKLSECSCGAAKLVNLNKSRQSWKLRAWNNDSTSFEGDHQADYRLDVILKTTASRPHIILGYEKNNKEVKFYSQSIR